MSGDAWREYAQQRATKWEQRIILKCGQMKCAVCGREWKKVGQRFAKPKCPDCGSRRPSWFVLEWVQLADGTVLNTGAMENMRGVIGILRDGAP